MNLVAKFNSLELDKMIRNIHFWIIIAIIGVLIVIYYGWDDWFPWFWRYFVFEFGRDIIGTLFLIPFLYASLVFWWRGAITVWALSAVAMLPLVIDYSGNLESFLFNSALSFIPLAVIIIITSELKWRDKQRRLLVEREEERQVYVSQIFKAQEDERRRIAQELHDGVTQELLVVANRAQTLVNRDGAKTAMEVKKQATWIRDAILQISEDIRRQSVDLRPDILDHMGLVPALRWLVNRLNEEDEIQAKMALHGAERKLNSETEVNIFRIVQEALNNIRHHSKATEAMVTLNFAPDSLEIKVQDNGAGFSLNETIGNLAAKGKLGLIGMEQRAKFIKSAFDIQSEVGQGTSVAIRVTD